MFSSTSFCINVFNISPLYITEIVSETSIISSNSNEISNMAFPLSLCSMSVLCTYSIAPPSRPLVGCTAINKSGSFAISLAITSFCWFPPDSSLISIVLQPSGQMSYSFIKLFVNSFICFLFSTPFFEKGSSLYFSKIAFSSTVKFNMMPCFCLSSCMVEILFFMISLGFLF